MTERLHGAPPSATGVAANAPEVGLLDRASAAMQQQLGLASFRLPAPEAGLSGSPLLAGAVPDALPASQVAAWVREARQQSVAALDWRLLLSTLAVQQTGAKARQSLVSLLAWAAEDARLQLEESAAGPAGASSGGGGGGGGGSTRLDAGDPRQLQAFQNTLKLSLTVLCCMARGQGGAAGSVPQQVQQAGGARRAKKTKGAGDDGSSAAAAATALAELQLRRDVLESLGAISRAVTARGAALMPAVSDVRAAERLWRAAALHCLAQPLAMGPGGAAAASWKLAGEASYQAMAGILVQPFLAATAAAAAAAVEAGSEVEEALSRRGAPAAAAAVAAARTLQELLVLVSEPKQAAQVLATAARLLADIAQQSSRAGAAIVSRLADHCCQLAADSAREGHGAGGASAGGGAGLTGQRLDSCLHFATLLATQGDSGGSGSGSGGAPATLAAAMLLCLPRLLPLARLPRGSTRRLALDLCSALLPAAARLPQPASDVGAGQAPGADIRTAPALPAAAAGSRPAYAAALLAVLVAGLSDRDATLRAKALASLEKHSSLLGCHLSSGGGNGGSSWGGDGDGTDLGDTFLAALRGRLCDKSPSVRKRAVALLAALTSPPQQQQHLGVALSPAGAARLAGAVLPTASQLLGLRPDSALHPGEEGVKALSEIVLRLAARGSAAGGVLPLLRLAGGVGEAAAREQLQAAVLGVLLPVGSPGDSGEALLLSLAAVVPQCSRVQVQQLREAVQVALAGGGGSRQAAAVSGAVRVCYQRLHLGAAGGGSRQAAADLQDEGQPGSASGTPVSSDGLTAEQLSATSAALFVLGPFSTADQDTCEAEAGLLLGTLGHLAAAAGSSSSIGSSAPAAAGGSTASSVCWLLASLTKACEQVLEAETSPGASQEGADVPAGQPTAGTALAQASLPVLQAVLLSPAGDCPAVQAGAVGALLALPPAFQAPLRLLRSLATACSASSVAAPTFTIPATQQKGAGNEAPSPEPVEADAAAKEVAGSASHGAAATATAAGSVASHAASGTAGEQGSAVQLRAVLASLGLLGAMASGYERQRTAFVRRMQTEAGQQAGAGGGEGAEARSKAGRPLRPAAEWWVGGGQAGTDGEDSNATGAAGSATAGPAGPAGPAGASSAQPSSFDYMRGEDQAAKQEAAAQRFLDSLLAAADTAPACYLPLLERLAGGAGAEGAVHVPQTVQAAALRALGRLAVLSEPLCRGAVELAEHCLMGSSSSSGGGGGGGSGHAGAEGSVEGSADSSGGAGGGSAAHCSGGDAGRACQVQAAAVSLLADAIDAHPNAFGSKLPLIGRLMVPGAVTGAAAAGTREPTAAITAASGAQPLAEAAAGAYCRLLLRNKLKLQDRGMLQPVGCALVGGSPRVSALVRHAMGQLLLAAVPKDRARLCLDLFHQTPLEHSWRQWLAQELARPSAGLLSEADLRGDVLVSQAVQALLAAAGAAGEAGPGIAAAGTLLRAMQPSGKVLAALSTQLQAAAGAGTAGSLAGKLPPAARQALAAFVGNHVAAPTGAAAAAAGAGEAGDDGPPAGVAVGAAQKRKRGQPASSVVLQQQVLGMLRGGGGAGGRHGARPSRRPSITEGGAASTGAATPAASGAPTASTASGWTRGGGSAAATSTSSE